MSNSHEVVIVGGGFSGLLCGYFLKEAGIEDFCILETMVILRSNSKKRYKTFLMMLKMNGKEFLVRNQKLI